MEGKVMDMKILYVEDDQVIRESIVKFLERRFKHVYSAENGLEGLKLFEHHSPDIIITDIQMPVMNGLEMVKKIKESAPSLPIVVMSAYSESSYLLSAIEIGIDHYILKPVDKKRLVSVLDDLAAIKLNELIIAEKTTIIDHILKGDPCLVVLSQDEHIQKINKMMWAVVSKQFNTSVLAEQKLKLDMLPIRSHDGGTEWFERMRELREGEEMEVNICCQEEVQHLMKAKLRHFPICNLDLITFSSDTMQLPC